MFCVTKQRINSWNRGKAKTVRLENERLKKSLGGGPVELGSEAAGMTEEEKAAMRAEIEAELRAQDCFNFPSISLKYSLIILTCEIENF